MKQLVCVQTYVLSDVVAFLGSCFHTRGWVSYSISIHASLYVNLTVPLPSSGFFLPHSPAPHFCFSVHASLHPLPCNWLLNSPMSDPFLQSLAFLQCSYRSFLGPVTEETISPGTLQRLTKERYHSLQGRLEYGCGIEGGGGGQTVTSDSRRMVQLMKVWYHL